MRVQNMFILCHMCTTLLIWMVQAPAHTYKYRLGTVVSMADTETCTLHFEPITHTQNTYIY